MLDTKRTKVIGGDFKAAIATAKGQLNIKPNDHSHAIRVHTNGKGDNIVRRFVFTKKRHVKAGA